MGIIAAGQITVVDLSDAPVLNAFITASRPTTQTYSKDSRNYNPSYASTPQVLTLNVTKSGSTTSIIDSISGLHWFVVDGSAKTEITSKVNTSNEYISGNYNENLTTKLNIDTTKGYRRYEATGIWRDPSTDLDVQFSASIDLLLTQNGATGPQGPQGDDGPQGPQGDKGETGNGIANTVVTYGLSMTDTTEPATWSSERPALVKGMYLWTRTVIIYTNGESTTSYQISYIPKDGDATGEIDKTKQELLEKLETVRDDSLAAVEEAKQQLETVRNDSLAAAEEAKQQVTSVANDLSKAKTDFQNAVATVDTKATNVQNDLSQAKQDLASQAQQLQEQANAQSELTNRVSSVEETANGTKTTVSELSKTVDQNSKNITSVTARTKVVEDDLSGTKTTLSQVKMTADSTSQKTATLETGLDGLSAKFENLNVGDTNLIKQSTAQKGWRLAMGADPWEDQKHSLTDWIKIEPSTVYTLTTYEDVPEENMWYSMAWYSTNNNDYSGWISRPTGAATAADLKGGRRYASPANAKYAKVSYPTKYAKVKLERGNISTDYSQNGVDVEQKVAEYKQTADQNYASLQTTVQNLDGTVQHNKTVAEQTAEGFKTRIESLETYKSGESTRANQYFELAKTETARQLSVERTAIAKDYVAKSTYTSDVTGIRNELSATTTTANTIKTNLANYQASNDRAVANLQSNIQTANGDISSLKTKVEAVPGQITSAVSAVEGKIPTSVGTTNLLLYSADPWQAPQTGYYQYFGTAKTGETYNGAVVYKTSGAWGRLGINLGVQLVERGLLKVGDVLTYSVLAKTDQETPIQSRLFVRYNNQSGAENITGKNEIINLTNEWQKVSVTFTVTEKMLSEDHRVSYLGWEQTTNSESGKYVYYTCNKIERGNIATDWFSAPEDAIKEISSLSSQIQQTADGMTLLATKTELNSAKNELQSGIKTATDKANNNAQTISTHTTQISALNTGLNAKVSQSDFNTLSGRVTTAENNITAKANELSSKITSVEGKIPTNLDSLNLMTGTRDWSTKTNAWHMGANWSTESNEYQGLKVHSTRNGWNGSHQNIFVKNGDVITFSFFAKATNTLSNIKVSSRWSDSSVYQAPLAGVKESDEQITITSEWKRYSKTVHITSDGSLQFRTEYDGSTIPNGNTFYVAGLKLAKSSQDTGYSENPKDVASDITRLSSTLTQTANGLEQLSTKVTSQGNTINTHTTQISALNTGLQAKVSQSDFNTLSGRVTTAENNITAKANELSSKITSVEGKIPTSVGGTNLLLYTADPWNAPNDYYQFVGATKTDEKLNGSVVYKTNVSWNCLRWNGGKHLIDRKNIKVGDELTYSIYAKTDQNSIQTMLFARYSGQSNAEALSGGITLTKEWKKLSVTFKVTSKMVANNTKLTWVGFEQTTNCESGKYVYYACNKLERGNISTDYDQAPEDAINQISSLSSEFKQTTDSIKASVQSLDNNTVKNSSLTINADGIVMKAGKSTTDVANAIGSYFAVNQNAINLFSDKIKVKGNMIVSGSISSDKISSSGITANVIKGGTLQSTNGSTNFELNTGKLFYNNNNTGVFRVQNGATTMGLKFSNTSLTVNGTSRILSRVILGGDRNETTLDDGKWDKGGFSGLVIETIKGVEPNVNERADVMNMIADNIYFTHTYNNDTLGPQGWKMETYSPRSSYAGNVVLKPYGVNYRNSDIVVGDIRLDNGDGSGYWMRATINTLKACFGHILNGGTSSQALNAIRSELNKISGT